MKASRMAWLVAGVVAVGGATTSAVAQTPGSAPAPTAPAPASSGGNRIAFIDVQRVLARSVEIGRAHV